MLLRPVGATPGSPPVAVWRKGRPPSTACAAKCVRRWAWTRRNPCSRAFSSRPFPTAPACGTATSPSSLRARRPPSRVRVPTCGRRGGLRLYPQTSRSGRTTSRISSVSSSPQPFSESPGWRGRNRGTKAGAARRRHSKRLLPGWGARCAGWGRSHPAGEPDHRALRTPPSARPLHAGLASVGDEALQGIWRRVAGALHPRDERRPIPSGPAGAEGSGHPLEGNGSGTRFVFGLPGVHRSRPGPRVDLARARCGRIVHLWPRDGLLCAGDDARRAATRSRDPRASRLDSRGRSETRGFGHGDQGNARAWRPFFGKSRTGEASDEGLNPSKNAVTRRRRIVEIDRAVSFDVVRERAFG